MPATVAHPARPEGGGQRIGGFLGVLLGRLEQMLQDLIVIVLLIDPCRLVQSG